MTAQMTLGFFLPETGIFTDEDGRRTTLSDPIHMKGVYPAAKIIMQRETSGLRNSSLTIDEIARAAGVVSELELAISNVTLDAVLPPELVNDFDARNDLRKHVSPKVGSGLRLGVRIAEGLLNG